MRETPDELVAAVAASRVRCRVARSGDVVEVPLRGVAHVGGAVGTVQFEPRAEGRRGSWLGARDLLADVASGSATS